MTYDELDDLVLNYFNDGAVKPKKFLVAALDKVGVPTAGLSYRDLQKEYITARTKYVAERSRLAMESIQASFTKAQRECFARALRI